MVNTLKITQVESTKCGCKKQTKGNEINVFRRNLKITRPYRWTDPKSSWRDETSNTTVTDKELAELQKKVKEYEATVNVQIQALAEAKKESAIKMALVSSKAKTTDIDYLWISNSFLI